MFPIVICDEGIQAAEPDFGRRSRPLPYSDLLHEPLSRHLQCQVSEDTAKILVVRNCIKDKDTETPVSSVSFATVSKILPHPGCRRIHRGKTE